MWNPHYDSSIDLKIRQSINEDVDLVEVEHLDARDNFASERHVEELLHFSRRAD